MQEFTDTPQDPDGDAPAVPDPAASPNEESGRKRAKGGTAVAGAALALICAGTVGYGIFGGDSAERATVRTKAPEPDASDAQTKAAIAMIQADGASAAPAGVAATEAAPDPTPAASASDAPALAATVTTPAPAPETAPIGDGGREPEPEPREAPSKANEQRSIYLGAAAEPRSRNADARAAHAAATAKPPAPVKPPFNTLLPVRTLGTILTVRSGGLARFELTRDMAGQGWSLRKGTQLVGVVRGGEADRAYVSLVGFIDPASNKLVKLGGDLLSGDGGSGLEGKRKRVGSAWGRALGAFARGAGRVVNGAAQVAIGSAVGGASARPVIISDAYGGGVLTLPSDLGGTARDSHYVEVKAGTPAYLLVTDLPDAVKGVDAVTEMAPEQIAEFADVAAAKPALGISEEELSRLMSDGTDDEIRAALPRMSPQMRRIAEQVLAGGRD